jgi:nucleoside-diphosphate-sugar epimerase
VAKLAITGGTGFVGTRLIALATAAGHEVRALTRREQAPREHIEWVAGDLGDGAALARLCEGADAVIHVAGVVNAPDRAGFAVGNIAGTHNMLSAAEVAGVGRFVHVSSLAAREPGMSDYGWSKAEAEELVENSLLDTIVVRPPAIYGPGDMEMLELFRLAKKGIALLPPGGRLSVIEVGDLGRLFLALAACKHAGRSFDCDDGRDNGWSHKEFGLVRGKGAKLTPDRVAYFCHEDWVIDSTRRPPASLWKPQVETHAGLAATAAWYREQGLL